MDTNSLKLLQAALEAEQHQKVMLAAQLYMEVLDVEPNCVAALVGLGGMAAHHGKIQEAEALLRKAVDIEPTHIQALKWLVTLTVSRGDGSEAVNLGRRASIANPRDAQAHAALGLALLGAGLNEEAIRSFEIAVQMEPLMAGAYHNLGVAHQRDEQFPEAIRAYLRAIELNPNEGANHLHLARSLLANGQPEQAIGEAEVAISLLPNSSAAKHVLTAANYQAVLADGAVGPLENALRREPHSAFLHALKGSRLQDLGDFAGAEVCLQESIRLNSKQGFAYYVLASNRRMSETDPPLFQVAIKHAQDKSISADERQYLNYGLGKLYDDLGDYERAMVHLELANELPPSESDAEEVKLVDRFIERSDRYIELIGREFIETFGGQGIDTQRPIFIVGMPRSGTTLLEQIISRHPEVSAAGEQSFWRDRGRRIIDLTTGEFNHARLQTVAEQYDKLLEDIGPGSSRVTDKFPSNYLYLGLLWLAFPNARFVHARRHPIDTCLSIYMRPFFVSQLGGNSKERIVANFQAYQRSIRHWRSVLPAEAFLDMNYEDLVSDRETQTRRLLEYLGLDWDERCLQPEQGERKVTTFSKWQVRQPVYQTSVERWKRYEPWLGAFKELQADEDLLPKA